ncbi:hypothetical protein B296_00014438 [Ensete ventricosum]|uniref:COBRA C-terminal domain-containing protein n=1 Tax=Ensete ventricosum TaxID=4639 RepID=A0A426Z5F1_ENSVE|nr:hypothetical protein B296_00014438 [Ensete ventricosum]
MCPVRVHWHVKLNYKDYWRAKIAITNFNYRMNYTLWTLVIQHPNLDNVTEVFSFDYKPLVPYGFISESAEHADPFGFFLPRTGLTRLASACRRHRHVLRDEVLQRSAHGGRGVRQRAVGVAPPEGREHVHVQERVGVSSEGVLQRRRVHDATAGCLPAPAELFPARCAAAHSAQPCGVRACAGTDGDVVGIRCRSMLSWWNCSGFGCFEGFSKIMSSLH